MKYISFILIFSLALLSCGTTTQEIESETQGTIIEKMSEDYDISSSNIKVKDYTLIQESDNVYTGLLETEYDDMTQTWDVKVVWDHDTDKYTVEWDLESER